MASRAAVHRAMSAARPRPYLVACRIPRSKATQHITRPYVNALSTAAGLPDARVGLVPVLGQPVEDPAERLAAFVAGGQRTQPVGLVGAVGELAVDVLLDLVGSPVADPHRARSLVAAEVIEGLLDEVGGAVDPVHDLQRDGSVGGCGFRAPGPRPSGRAARPPR